MVGRKPLRRRRHDAPPSPPLFGATPRPTSSVLLRLRGRGRGGAGRPAPHGAAAVGVVVGAAELPLRGEAAVLGEGGAGGRARPGEVAPRRARQRRLPQARRLPRMPLPRLRPHRPLLQGPKPQLQH